MSISDYTPGYISLFGSCIVNPAKLKAVDAIIAKIMEGKPRYEAVEAKSSVPWFVIGLIHNLECSLRFDQHLHNGDSLKYPTRNDPAGRPPGWDGTGTWEESALDALKYDRLTTVKIWNLPRILFSFETFNGFGYRRYAINSPYLWGGSNHYTKGKYVRDHVFDPEARTDQIGTGVLLFRMVTGGLVALKAEAAET